MLAFLEGISPFYWLAFALIIGVFEMLGPTSLLLWPALGALSVGGALFAFPDMSGGVQVVLFAVSSAILALVGRWAVPRMGKGDRSAEHLNNPAIRVVGEIAEVIESNGLEGRVVVGGVRWHARWPEGKFPAIGERVRITGAEGSTLTVEPLVEP